MNNKHTSFHILPSKPEFHDWFRRAYKRWTRSQPGEEDFLGFCALLGYPPPIVLGWFEGDSIPQGAEVLSIAGVFGLKVYQVLGQPEPAPELVEIYNAFGHLRGELRANLAQAIWEVQIEMQQRGIPPESKEMKSILAETFKKWGF